MAKLALKVGSTSKLLRLFIQDATSGSGAGLTGLLYNATGLKAAYIVEGQAAATTITLATMTVGTWATGGFKEIDATNLPGLYEFGVPNAVLTGGNSAVVLLFGATNMVPVVVELELDAIPYATGLMLLDQTQAITSAPGQGTLGDALIAAEAQGAGKWTIVGTTLTLYRHDGTTTARVFTLDSSTSPTSRT